MQLCHRCLLLYVTWSFTFSLPLSLSLFLSLSLSLSLTLSLYLLRNQTVNAHIKNSLLFCSFQLQCIIPNQILFLLMGLKFYSSEIFHFLFVLGMFQNRCFLYVRIPNGFFFLWRFHAVFSHYTQQVNIWQYKTKWNFANTKTKSSENGTRECMIDCRDLLLSSYTLT